MFGLTSFVNDTANEMAYWILPAFLVSIGAGPATLGFIEAISESVASGAKLGSRVFPLQPEEFAHSQSRAYIQEHKGAFSQGKRI